MDDASHFDLLEQRLVPQSGDGGTPLVSIERGFTERSNSRSNSRSNTAFFAGGQDVPVLAPQPPQAAKMVMMMAPGHDSPQDVAQPPATPALPEQRTTAHATPAARPQGSSSSYLAAQATPVSQEDCIGADMEMAAGISTPAGASPVVQHVDKRQRLSSDNQQTSPAQQQQQQQQHISPSQLQQQQQQALLNNVMPAPPARNTTGQKSITGFFKPTGGGGGGGGGFGGGGGGGAGGGRTNRSPQQPQQPSNRRLSTDSSSNTGSFSSPPNPTARSVDFPSSESSSSTNASNGTLSSPPSFPPSSFAPPAAMGGQQQQQQQERLRQMDTQLQQQREELRREQEAHSASVHSLRLRETELHQRLDQNREVIKKLMTDKSDADAIVLRKRLALDSHRLGREVMRPSHVHRGYSEKCWEDGQDLEEVKRNQKRVKSLLDQVQAENQKRIKEARKAARKSKEAFNSANNAASNSSSSSSSSSGGGGGTGGGGSGGDIGGVGASITSSAGAVSSSASAFAFGDGMGAYGGDGNSAGSNTVVSSSSLFGTDNRGGGAPHGAGAAGARLSRGGGGGGVSQPHGVEEWMEDALQAYEVELSGRAREESLRREEARLRHERKSLELETVRHRRESKLVRQEGESERRRGEVMHSPAGDYLLMSLLGKGGFSEVWQAYDLRSLNLVAVKILRVDPCWSEEKRRNYAHHATREYRIHRIQKHPYVVRLLDVFEIDANAFATVLECCDGGDLDMRLKSEPGGCLPESEARPILLQVLAGLRYLNTPDAERLSKGVKSVIHYDLKPGNILFDSKGNAKITDFGLSKIVSAQDNEDIELTSQGTGTYWYLPPECFQIAGHGGAGMPRITSAVDVFSCGVIFFQMLYGQRPFGHNQSQEQLLSNRTMENLPAVVFPDETAGWLKDKGKFKVSESAKEFIRACLKQHGRPDVQMLCEHQYLRAPEKAPKK